MEISTDTFLAPLDRLAELLAEDEWFEGVIVTQREASLTNRIRTLLQQKFFCVVVSKGPGQAVADDDEDALAVTTTYTISIARNTVTDTGARILPECLARVLAAVHGQAIDPDVDDDAPDNRWAYVGDTPMPANEKTPTLEGLHITFRAVLNLF